MARQDEYEELLGYYSCNKCQRKSPKQVLCCRNEMQLKDQFLFYFTEESSHFGIKLIELESRNSTIMSKPITFKTKSGADKTVFVFYRRDPLPDSVHKWLNEYVR